MDEEDEWERDDDRTSISDREAAYVVSLVMRRPAIWRLMHYFVRREGELVTPEEVQGFMGGTWADMRTAVSKLKRHVNAEIGGDPCMTTEWGKG